MRGEEEEKEEEEENEVTIGKKKKVEVLRLQVRWVWVSENLVATCRRWSAGRFGVREVRCMPATRQVPCGNKT